MFLGSAILTPERVIYLWKCLTPSAPNTPPDVCDDGLFWDPIYLEQRSFRCLEMSGVSSACIM